MNVQYIGYNEYFDDWRTEGILELKDTCSTNGDEYCHQLSFYVRNYHQESVQLYRKVDTVCYLDLLHLKLVEVPEAG